MVSVTSLLAGVRDFWVRHWIEIVLALAFAAVMDSLRVGSVIRNVPRRIKNKIAEQSVKRLRTRIRELEQQRDATARYLSSDKALYLATLRVVLGVLLCMCMAGTLITLSNFRAFPQFAEVRGAPFELFTLLFLGLGIVLVLAGTRITSLDSQGKVSEMIAKLDGEIAVLQAKLDEANK